MKQYNNRLLLVAESRKLVKRNQRPTEIRE